MPRLTFLSFVVVVVIGMALALFVTSETSYGGGHDGSCYPDNEFVIEPGDFEVTYDGEGDLTGEIEIPPDTKIPPDPDDAEAFVEWEFWEKVTGNTGTPGFPSPGTMQGKLNIDIDWDDPSLKDTKFRSDCIAEAVEDDGESFEAELEGWVEDFPHQIHPRRAVASIVGGDNGRIHIGIELGTTCFEELITSTGSFIEFEITLGGTADKFRFRDVGGSSGFDQGMWGFPTGYPIGAESPPISSSPCPAVF